jgi:hypothetical protein
MSTAAPTASGPDRSDLRSDLREGPWGNGREDGIKHLEQMFPLLLAEVADPLRVLPDRLADDITLRSGQSGGSLAEAIHRRLIKGERQLDHSGTISPYSTRVKRDGLPSRTLARGRSPGTHKVFPANSVAPWRD